MASVTHQSARRSLGGLNGSTSTGLRAAIYIRVSSEEQLEGYSLDAQRRAAEGYCEAHGWTVARIYADEGKSARTDDLGKRPEFRALLADAESGLIDVVLVHKLDRFARNLRVTLETLERLERCRVAFASIAENMDFTSAIGKVILATLAAFAQYYSDNLSWETKKGKQERKEQGLYNGHLPFGIKKSREGLPVPDPDTYPALLLAFRLAAEGKSDREVADGLNAAGYRMTGNRGRNPFTKDTLRPLLQNRFYLGELPDGRGGWMAGAHGAVLDEDLYDAAQRARAANRRGFAAMSSPARRYALSGLARCGHCGGPLHFHTRPNGTTAVYCYQKRQAGASPCAQRETPLAGIEAQIGDYLATFRLPDETVARIVRLHAAASEQHDDSERQRRESASRLERIAELYKWGDMTREAYRGERAQLERQLADLRGTSSRADLLAKTADFLRNLPAAWAAANAEQRNALARLVFQGVAIKADRAVAIQPQPDFAPFFLAAAGNDDTPDSREPGCQGSGLTGGSDGDAALTLDTSAGPWLALPDLRPECGTASRRGRYSSPRTTIPPERWDEVRASAASVGQRATARTLGVSHETVRQIVRRESKATASCDGVITPYL